MSFNYESAFLVCREAYTNLSKKDAESAYRYFLTQVPVHVDFFIRKCCSDMGLNMEYFDFSETTLITAWSWFLKYGKWRPYTSKEKAELEIMFGKFGPSMIGDGALTDETEKMAQDIGLYLAEVFLHNYSNIKWDYVRKPKRDMFFQNPVLVGFVNTDYGKPFNAVFHPIHMAGVQAVRLMKGNATKEDLFNLYKKWERYAVNGE